MTSFIFDAIGTHWQIDIGSVISDKAFIGIKEQIGKRVEEFDRNYSRFRGDSFVRLLASKPGVYDLPDDSKPLFDLYRQLYNLTDGRFTPLIGDVLVEAGYDEAYSLRSQELHAPASWDDAFSVRSGQIVIRQPRLLDFGAAGKGYLIDLISVILEEEGVRSYCVDGGGDIRFRSKSKITHRVGLENPEDPGQVIGVAFVGNESSCASAGNRRRWGEFHHIIDPYTLSSPGASRHPALPPSVIATWVVSKTTMIADALATCLFFVAPEVLLKRYAFEYVVLYKDFSVKKSEGFRGEVFVEDVGCRA